jgi:hypothetical protein
MSGVIAKSAATAFVPGKQRTAAINAASAQDFGFMVLYCLVNSALPWKVVPRVYVPASLLPLSVSS